MTMMSSNIQCIFSTKAYHVYTLETPENEQKTNRCNKSADWSQSRRGVNLFIGLDIVGTLGWG